MSDEERREMYKMKTGTVEGEFEFFRAVIKTMERRMDDEQAFRVRNEDDLRGWFE